MKIAFAFALLLAASGLGFAQNEQAPIVEKDITYKNWKLKRVGDGTGLELRKLMAGKWLVAVVYFSPWCPNWRHDAPMLQRLYDKYRSAGFEIVAVSEYDSLANAKINIDALKITFPVVYDSQDRSDRDKSKHFKYRQAAGDTRRWGSPWYIFIETEKAEAKGDPILKRAHVINGEMIETEGEKFVRAKLGLAALDPKATTAESGEVEICDPNEKKRELKKPN